ncbi:Gamma-aminobutyric acid (GABA) B receptor [Seminavis robusta]|uniref:Gamma-aminobutyric acid (GABA) B receptor n=1 Tax=Seminavis robusta TaxID=568900 RepID=A0A9N8HVZ4_9STRA|nr:Gamma-aminobutyric acid (GABA) B receptor [Seminavis robusta]|eukprot:Sro2097_g314330.1 Gamma-aminobutyric acid (GABA) B receptor (377) ;mRNA; f:7104-8234
MDEAHLPATLDPTMEEEEYGVLSEGVRIAGLVLMSIPTALGVFLMTWIVWNRNATVVKMMQPEFLFLICLGIVVSSLVIIPMGANPQNTANINAACASLPWFEHLGVTITDSALFSKLKRVNEIFHAQGFQRKVVTIQDVLKPFVILMSINVISLIVMTATDPPTWTHKEGEASKCDNIQIIGVVLDLLLSLVNFIALIILCVQAYRAKDIDSDFSEARGVALALFTTIISLIIVSPTEEFLQGPDDVNALHVLLSMEVFAVHTSTLLFIFAPIMAHHRKRQRGTTTQSAKKHISGLDSNNISPARNDNIEAITTPNNEGSISRLTFKDEPGSSDQMMEGSPKGRKSMEELELELEALRSRLSVYEGGHHKPTEPV